MSESTLENDLMINENCLSEEFIKQAALLAFYGVAYQNAAAQRRAAETELEFVEAEAMQAARALLADEPKVTEGKVKEVVLTNDTYQEQCREANRLLAIEGSLKVQYEAVQEKGRMLMSFGGVRRAELESNVRMLSTGGR